MVLGLLSCSSAKLPVPAPAWLMYSRSPQFSQQYTSLKAKCDMVRIVSAKYGLLEPEQPIAPYNQKADANSVWVKDVSRSINALEPDQIVSYLSLSYRKVLQGVRAPVVQIDGGIFDKSKAIGKQGKLRRGRRWAVVWPVEWLLVLVAERGPLPLEEVLAAIRARYPHKGTVHCQLERVVKCPLHHVEGGVVRNAYVKNRTAATRPTDPRVARDTGRRSGNQ